VGSTGWISYGDLKRAYLNITLNAQVPYQLVIQLVRAETLGLCRRHLLENCGNI